MKFYKFALSALLLAMSAGAMAELQKVDGPKQAIALAQKTPMLASTAVAGIRAVDLQKKRVAFEDFEKLVPRYSGYYYTNGALTYEDLARNGFITQQLIGNFNAISTMNLKDLLKDERLLSLILAYDRLAYERILAMKIDDARWLAMRGDFAKYQQFATPDSQMLVFGPGDRGSVVIYPEVQRIDMTRIKQ